MNLQDDELVRRYHEASAQEGARPGAHVREAVRLFFTRNMALAPIKPARTATKLIVSKTRNHHA